MSTWTRRDASLFKAPHQITASATQYFYVGRRRLVRRKEANVRLVTMNISSGRRWSTEPTQFTQRLIVPTSDLRTAGQNIGRTIHLRTTNSCLDIGHTIIESELRIRGEQKRLRVFMAYKIGPCCPVITQASR